jgi:copper chaperone NosL
MLERVRFDFISVVLIVFFLAGCWSSSNTGPGEIHWDRQTCERCQMVISERRHAVQIRELGERQTHAFDDLGCALLWLEEQGLLAGSDEGPEVWARATADGDWSDARAARFETGLTTPMGYGFGVADSGISLGEVQAQTIETERRRRSRSVKQTNPHDHRDHEKGEDVE